MKTKSNKSGFARLRSKPIIWNFILIMLTLAALAIVAYLGLSFGTRHGKQLTVPNFTGLSLSDAQYYASKRGLNIIVSDSLFVPAYPGGIVLEQLPKGGVAVKKGRKIYITINSFAQKRVPMPFVAGRSLRQAKNMLEGAGFGIDTLVYVEDIATNYVLAQYFEGVEVTAESGLMVEKGRGVTLRVGVRPEQNSTTVPRLIGRKLYEAKSRLWEVGLNVDTVTYEQGITLLNLDDARVCRQSILQGSAVTLGERVSLHLTLDAAAVDAAAAAAERQIEENLRQQAILDSLAQVTADSLRLINNDVIVEPQPQQADDEFFF